MRKTRRERVWPLFLLALLLLGTSVWMQKQRQSPHPIAAPAAPAPPPTARPVVQSSVIAFEARRG